MTEEVEHTGMISGIDALKISRDIVQAFLKAAIDKDNPLERTRYVDEMRTTVKVLNTLIKVGEDNAPDPDNILVIKVPT